MNLNLFFVTLRLLICLSIITHSLHAQRHEVVRVLETQQFYLNGGNRAMLGGKSRTTVAITLPPNTVEWYYKFSAYRTQVEADRDAQAYSLFANLVSSLSQVGIAALGAQLMKPTGSQICDVFLLPEAENSHFLAKNDNAAIGTGQGFRSYPAASRQNFTAGIVPVKQPGLNQGTYYLGIRNPSAMSGIHVNVEVDAIIQKDSPSERQESALDNAPSQPTRVDAKTIVLRNLSTVAIRYQYSSDGANWQTRVIRPNYQANLLATGSKATALVRLQTECTGEVTYRLDAANQYQIHYTEGCWEIAVQ